MANEIKRKCRVCEVELSGGVDFCKGHWPWLTLEGMIELYKERDTYRDALLPFTEMASKHGIRPPHGDDLWVSFGVAHSKWWGAIQAFGRRFVKHRAPAPTEGD